MKSGRCKHLPKREFKKVMIGYKDASIPAKKSYQICSTCNIKDEVTKNILMK